MTDMPLKALTRIAAPVVATVMLLAVALEAAASATPQIVAITMRHSRFAPADLIVRRGTTVRFVVTNTDPIDHELIIGDEAVQLRHETGTEAAHGAVPGEVSVAPGRTAETSYTFTRPGVLLIGCHAPGHYNYGMRGRVLVVY